MKLLIVTQAVDIHDPILGFFHRWIEEFSKRFESIEVICLKEGEHSLPDNVKVYSLGKENGGNSFMYAVRFLKLVWELRASYDRVFVHMNPEYIVLAGWFWKLWQKSVGLWYTHKTVNLKLRVAEFFSDIIFTASKESFRLSSKKVYVTGHGIDTNFFTPDPSIVRDRHLLSVGRLMKSKRHDLAIRAAHKAGAELRIAGEGLERKNLEVLAHELKANIYFLGALTQEMLRDEYRRASFFIHTSETGSLDKTVLEAFASGCPVITTNKSLYRLPVIVSEATPEAIAYSVTINSNTSPQYSEYVRTHHSLPRLIQSIYERYVALS